MWKKIINFVKKLLSPNSGVSHKRVISLFSFILFTMAFILSFFGVIIPELYINSSLILILGQSFSTLMEKKGGKNDCI